MLIHVALTGPPRVVLGRSAVDLALPGGSCTLADLLDALAAAVTGLIGRKKLQTLPPSPERDPYGLPMEMVYFSPGC